MTVKIIYRIFLFLLLLIGSDQIIGSFLDYEYEKNNCYFSNGEINDFIQHKSCDTLIVGSSRVLHMIDPALLGPKTMNLAKQEKHNYYHTAIIDILASKRKLPNRLLILNLEVEDLFMEKENSLIAQVNSLKYYYSKNKTTKLFIDKQGVFERIKFLSRIYHHNSSGLSLLTNPIENVCPDFPYNGYIPLKPTLLDSVRLKRSLGEDLKPIKNQRTNQTIFENLLQIQKRCQDAGIDLIIVDAPYFKVHPAFKLASRTIQQFCNKNNLKFIDFKFEQIPGLEDSSCWYDNMHTNEKGSRIYTRYFKLKIAELTIQ